MKANSGLYDDARREVRQMLNHILADEFGLFTTTRDCRANVTGPDYQGLRQQLEVQCGQIGEWIDQVAERVRVIAVGASGTWAGLAKATRTLTDAGTGLSAEHVIWELLSLHEEMIVQLFAAREACTERYQDADTADFLAGLMEQHQKIAWRLRAEFETEGHQAWSAQPHRHLQKNLR